VVEEFPFGPETSVFKVGGKMFALTALDTRPLTVSLKCEPALAEALRAEHSAVRPGYHLNKRHWITVARRLAARRAGLRAHQEQLRAGRRRIAARARPRSLARAVAEGAGQGSTPTSCWMSGDR
jgi:hypothetical protein